jgi:hypothetical protein
MNLEEEFMPRRTIETQKAGSRGERNASVMSPSEGDVRELIALRAYELYLEHGADGGNEVTDWLTAEAEVLSCLQTIPLDEQPRTANGAKKTASKLAVPSRARKTPAATSSRKNRPRSEAAPSRLESA